MREVIYKYNTRGMYMESGNTNFSGESHLKLVVEPHQFSMVISGEVIRDTSFPGCTIIVSHEGGAVFYDHEGQIMAQVEKGPGSYKEVRFGWKQDCVSLGFGEVREVDYYPHCDGEYDRWGTEWVTQREVILDLKDHSIEVN